MVSDRDLAVAVVDEVSDELKDHLRARLGAYCFGSELAREDADYYSFQETIRQLLERFDAKAPTLQIGMAGELLTHLVLEAVDFGLTSGGVFFNKEEKHIKKGFDLMFLQDGSTAIWYGEVKSGEAPYGTADSKAHQLLLDAARDLADKLNGGASRSRWDSAVIDAGLALASSEATSMKRLLRRDTTVLDAGERFPINAVLGGVVFHDFVHCELTESEIRATSASIAASGKFAKLRIVAAQQSTFVDLINFLRTEVDPNA
jgi:hypothetical protein